MSPKPKQNHEKDTAILQAVATLSQKRDMRLSDQINEMSEGVMDASVKKTYSGSGSLKDCLVQHQKLAEESAWDQAQWYDYLLRSFQVPQNNSWDKYLASLMSLFGSKEKQVNLIDIIDELQVSWMWQGHWTPALALEQLKLNIEKESGQSFFPYGLTHGSLKAKKIEEKKPYSFSILFSDLSNYSFESSIDPLMVILSQKMTQYFYMADPNPQSKASKKEIKHHDIQSMLESIETVLNIAPQIIIEPFKYVPVILKSLLKALNEQELDLLPPIDQAVYTELSSFCGQVAGKMMNRNVDMSALFESCGIFYDGNYLIEMEHADDFKPHASFFAGLEKMHLTAQSITTESVLPSGSSGQIESEKVKTMKARRAL